LYSFNKAKNKMKERQYRERILLYTLATHMAASLYFCIFLKSWMDEREEGRKGGIQCFPIPSFLICTY
jgi:hypothetical protein